MGGNQSFQKMRWSNPVHQNWMENLFHYIFGMKLAGVSLYTNYESNNVDTRKFMIVPCTKLYTATSQSCLHYEMKNKVKHRWILYITCQPYGSFFLSTASSNNLVDTYPYYLHDVHFVRRCLGSSQCCTSRCDAQPLHILMMDAHSSNTCTFILHHKLVHKLQTC
jgi:hypothetical protein